MSARQYDANGWYEIADNPLSRAGIFEYLGSSIGAPDPEKVYRVLRPVDVLSDPDCIESFRLVPWIIDHTMLGQDETPAEQVGVEGVIGENVWFDEDDNTLKGNIKVFSDGLKDLVDTGLNELSLGYKCKYDFDHPGTLNGEPYDVIQTQIRGNHVASVEEGRMGHEVAVLDSAVVTFDSQEFKQMAATQAKAKGKAPRRQQPKLVRPKATQPTGDAGMMNGGDMEGEMTLESLGAMVKQLMPLMEQVEMLKTALNGNEDNGGEMSGMEMEENGDMEHEMDEEEARDEEEEAEDQEEDKNGMDAIRKELKSIKRQLSSPVQPAMDSKTLLVDISNRDQLNRKLSRFVGTMDASDKTYSELAAYGVNKLGIPHIKGQEIAAVEAWLHDRNPPEVIRHRGMDSASKPGAVDALFNKRRA